MLYSINLPNFNAKLLLILALLGNMFIVTTCFPVDDVQSFDMNPLSDNLKLTLKALRFAFLSSRFYQVCMTKKVSIKI